MDKQYEVEPVILDTTHKSEIVMGSDLWNNRRIIYQELVKEGAPRVSIYIQAYNRLEKTRYCVECVLKYTCDIDFELILIDNGSEDGTYDYFQSVPWKEKQIIRVTKNIGMIFPWYTLKQIYRGKYLVGLPNDVYVTKNWLSNLLRCMESDSNIGFVVPVSSNVSNLQQVDLPFNTMEEMQESAARFNNSDPSKWAERMRLISLVNIFKREVLDLVGIPDCGFSHNFNEDDYAARLRQAGYRLMLCKDTYVCHDHDFRNGDNLKLDEDCSIGWKNFLDKHHLDGWGDFCNFEGILIDMLNPKQFPQKAVSALSIDVRCGTPILEIRNRFKAAKTRHKIISLAFTTQAKYYNNLLHQAEYVVCDRIDFIGTHYKEGSMDLILLGEPLNQYSQPITLLNRLLLILKRGGVLLLKRQNMNTFHALLQNLKMEKATEGSFSVTLSEEEFVNCLVRANVSNLNSTAELYDINDETKALIENIAETMNPDLRREISIQLMTKEYHCCIVK